MTNELPALIDFKHLDLKSLSKPACKLIDVLAAGCGKCYEPIHVMRMAKAETEADLIRAKAGDKLAAINARAEARVYFQEQRHQRNIESIVEQAAKALPKTVSEESVDDDFAAAFFDHCQGVGDEQMQVIWAKVLAGEIAEPGSFSLRTLATIKTMQKVEAESFTLLCNFAWEGNRDFIPLIHSRPTDPYKILGLSYGQILRLEAAGLIQVDQIKGFSLSYPVNEIDLLYHGRTFRFTLSEQKLLDCGPVMFTQVGNELARIAGGALDETYLNALIESFDKVGINITEIDPTESRPRAKPSPKPPRDGIRVN